MTAPRVRLALLVPRFAGAVQGLAEDPAIGATSMLPSPYPPDGAATFIRATMAKRARGEEYAFAILADDEVAGTVGLANVGGGEAELGYWVGRPFQRRGLATAAARLALRYAFSRLGLRRVVAHCLKRNVPSYRVLEKAGLRYAGDGFLPGSKWPTEPVARFTLDRETWLEASRARASESAGSTTRAGTASSTRRASPAGSASRTRRGSSARSS